MRKTSSTGRLPQPADFLGCQTSWTRRLPRLRKMPAPEPDEGQVHPRARSLSPRQPEVHSNRLWFHPKVLFCPILEAHTSAPTGFRNFQTLTPASPPQLPHCNRGKSQPSLCPAKARLIHSKKSNPCLRRWPLTRCWPGSLRHQSTGWENPVDRATTALPSIEGQVHPTARSLNPFQPKVHTIQPQGSPKYRPGPFREKPRPQLRPKVLFATFLSQARTCRLQRSLQPRSTQQQQAETRQSVPRLQPIA
jgi:hypothetical protein